MSFRFRLVTPERTLIDASVSSVTLPTTTGELTILPTHAEIATLVAPGVIHYRTENDKMEEVAVSGGFLHVNADHSVTALTETAERGEELDLSSIEEAKKRAEEVMKQAVVKDDVSFASAAAALQRELARFKLATKHRQGKILSTAHGLPVSEQASIKKDENEE